MPRRPVGRIIDVSCDLPRSSFRDAPSWAQARNPSRDRLCGQMDSGLSLRAPRNDAEISRHTQSSSPPPGRANARPMTGSGGEPICRGGLSVGSLTSLATSPARHSGMRPLGRRPGIHRATYYAVRWIPGSRCASPGMTWSCRHKPNCRPRESGDPVRRGFSVQSLPSLEYWIPAFAGMTAEYDFAFSRHVCPRLAQNLPPSNREGAGKTGCAPHRRSRVQWKQKVRTRAYRFGGSIPAFPAQWLYGLLRAPRRTALLPPSPPRNFRFSTT